MFLLPWMQNRVEQWKSQYLSKGADAVIFAEGDSWFDYPFMEDRYPVLSPSNYDLLAHLAREFVITSTARHGDEIAQMVSDDQMAFNISTVERVRGMHGRFAAALISAGGNDIVGNGGSKFVQILRAGPQARTCDYIRFEDEGGVSGYTSRLDAMMDGYRKYLGFVAEHMGVTVPVIGHTYDYPYPDGKVYRLGGVIDVCGPWFKNRFDEQGTPEADRKPVIRLLMDTFAERLQKLVTEFPNFHVVDLRGVVQDESLWQNEMHATDEGYRRLSEPLADMIRRVALK